MDVPHSVCVLFLLEVTTQQTLESLAVSRLVARHLMDGVLAALAGRFASYGKPLRHNALLRFLFGKVSFSGGKRF